MKNTLFRIVPVALAAIILASCGNKMTPEQEKIIDLISQTNAEVKGATFLSFELVDSTTVGQELERREALFVSKANIEERNALKYESRNMPVNAKKHRASQQRALAAVDGVKEIRANLAGNINDVLYRTYKFSCKGMFTDRTKFQCEDMYANITIDGSACNLTNDTNYHKGMGRYLPGYIEMLKQTRTSDE